MYASCKNSNTSKQFIIHSLILTWILVPDSRHIRTLEVVPNDGGAMVLVLDDCDSDNKLSTPPYGDIAFLLNSKCELVRKFHGFSIHSPFFNGPINISASDDGRFYVLCESAPGKLTVYETAKRRELWTLWMDFESAIFANDLI